MARRFRFGICTDQNMTWDKNVERWQLFERLGYESAWVCDHLVQPSRPNGPYLEAWSLLAGLAARTEKIRIGVLVTSNTFRFPQVVAKMAVTIDHISNGRLEVGLGAGWYEPEHTMFGIPFPETKELAADAEDRRHVRRHVERVWDAGGDARAQPDAGRLLPRAGA
jgi:alkanesulfonate monooxygenase SsuD/methylene tetrahydromethanopterin reductase-like flavin-dependent oxidoreductase (luciferase family)